MTVENIRISQEEESIQDVALDSPEAPASLCITCSVVPVRRKEVVTQNASHVTITDTFVTPVIYYSSVPSTTMSEQAAIGKLNSNNASKYVDVKESALCTNLIHSGTLFKLIIFSLSLGIVPLTSYYASLHFLWSGT